MGGTPIGVMPRMSEHRDDNVSLNAATIEWIDRAAPYGVFTTDAELRIQSWNQWMQQHSGITAAQALHRKLTELFPDLLERGLMGHFERALMGQVSVLSTALHGYLIALSPPTRETGFARMQQTVRVAPLISKGVTQGAIVVIEDVTQREWQSDTLRLQHVRDEILSWALAHLLKADEPRRVTRELFCKVAEHLDFDTYLLYLLDRADGAFKLSSAGGITPEVEQAIQNLPAESIPAVASAKIGGAILRENVGATKDPAYPFTDGLGFRAFILFPLMTGSTLHGFLTFATCTRDTIDHAEADVLGTIAQYLAVALNRENTDNELREAQKRLSEHAQELEKKVAERTASLKQIIAELQTFSYTIAHDLRAPIRALTGYCEVLLEDYADQTPPGAKDVVGKLRKAAGQMDALTRDLLEFSKVSRQDITIKAVDLTEVVTEIVAARGPAVMNYVSIKRPLHTALANRTLVGQCVSNLLENAVKFSRPEAQPSITIWSEIVVGSAQAPPETSHFSRSQYSLTESAPAAYVVPQNIRTSETRHIRLWLEDRGIGISSEAQSKIFGIFERGDMAGQYEGTGIGLAIVARAMERMGGQCGVESKLGVGSRFWLVFRCP